MIIGQAIFQLIITLVLYFVGANILNYDTSDPDQVLQLNTVIFNTFVWMQIFNEFNNRRLDNKFNIFEGIHRNYFFIGINILMVGLQVLIIFVGGRAFEIHEDGLDGTQWAISIVLAVFCWPWAVLVRLFPDAWFATIAGIVGYPVVVVYRFLGKMFRAMWSPFGRLFRRLTKKENKGEGEDEEAPAAPDAPTVHITSAD
jgi:Ca2+-transporting ATPase